VSGVLRIESVPTHTVGLVGPWVAAILDPIKHVLATSPVPEIRQAVVRLVVIAMQDFHALGDRSNESQHHKLVDTCVLCGTFE